MQDRWERVMIKGLLGSIGACLAAAGLAFGGDPPAKLGWPEIAVDQVQDSAVGPNPAGGLQQPPEKEKPKEEMLPKPLQPPDPMTGYPATAEMDAGMMQRNGTKVDLRDYHCGPDERFWARGDYVHWWTKRGPLHVPLVATGIADPNFSAVPSTVLFGGQGLDYRSRSGGLLTLGLWLDEQHITGFEASGFLLEKPRIAFAANSPDGSLVLARPFFAAEQNLVPQNSALLIAFPNILAGGVTISSTSRFWGAEANFARNVAHHCGWDVNLLFGFRYLSLDEHLLINQSSTVLQAQAPGVVTGIIGPGNQLLSLGDAGSTVNITDTFGTQNNFYGAQIGTRIGYRSGMWTVEVQTKVAMGPTHEGLNVFGSTQQNIVLNGPPPSASSSNATAGFLALATNSGHDRTNWFSVVPEVGINLGCQVSSHVRALAGYNFLYMNSVIRPGNQVNLNINRAFLPTISQPGSATNIAEPSKLFKQNEFWAHGVNFGMLISF